jgi:hypothetical protein
MPFLQKIAVPCEFETYRIQAAAVRAGRRGTGCGVAATTSPGGAARRRGRGVGLYALLGFWVAPWVVRSQAPERLGRPWASRPRWGR